MIMLICLIVTGLVCPGCKPSSSDQLEENKALVRHGYKLLEERDWVKLAELYASDFIYYSPERQEPGTREDFMQYLQRLEVVYPDFSDTIEDIIAEGDKVVVRELWRGTNKGDIEELGITATGKVVTLPVIIIFRIKDGKVVEMWQTYDMMSVMQQLGAMPTGEQAL